MQYATMFAIELPKNKQILHLRHFPTFGAIRIRRMVLTDAYQYVFYEKGKEDGERDKMKKGIR